MQTPEATEKHYSPAEIASMWGVSVNSIRRLFDQEPGVLRIEMKRLASVRPYVTLRIPASVLDRLHQQRSGCGFTREVERRRRAVKE